MDNLATVDPKIQRRTKLLAYLKKKYEPATLSDDVEEEETSYSHLPENHPNYEFSHWHNEMLFHRQNLKDIIFEVSCEKKLDYNKLYEEQWNKYVNNDELEQRNIAIREWFDDCGFDGSISESLFTDIMDRDKYIWKHHDSAIVRTHETLTELANVNKRKIELEKQLVN